MCNVEPQSFNKGSQKTSMYIQEQWTLQNVQCTYNLLCTLYTGSFQCK